MSLQLLSKDKVVAIHDYIIEHAQGYNPDSYNTDRLDGILGRIENTILYSDVNIDGFELAAIYAEAFARGHGFPDGNKRTAFVSAITVLMINIDLPIGDEESYIDNAYRLQNASFMTEFMVLVAEGKVNREEIKQTFMTLFAGTVVIAGAGFAIYKIVEFLVHLFDKK